MMTMRSIAFLALLFLPGPARAGALLTTPARAGDVVSLNLCTDEFLVLLAPDRVAALSPLARDPSLSVVAATARHLPWVRADAEAVLMLHPALVLAGPYGAQTTLAVLAQAGLRVVRTALPRNFAAIRAETSRLAGLLGVPARGAALLAKMDARLAAIPRHPPLRALALAPRGYTAAAGSLEDAVLRAAGLVNAGTGARVGLEAILAHPPDLLVVQQAPDFPSLATDMLQHPALAGIPRRSVPPALLACGGPWTAQAVQILTVQILAVRMPAS
jgi:iron complex transport system substrate-binding protein